MPHRIALSATEISTPSEGPPRFSNVPQQTLANQADSRSTRASLPVLSKTSLLRWIRTTGGGCDIRKTRGTSFSRRPRGSCSCYKLTQSWGHRRFRTGLGKYNKIPCAKYPDSIFGARPRIFLEHCQVGHVLRRGSRLDEFHSHRSRWSCPRSR
jgi:hypothetical protein